MRRPLNELPHYRRGIIMALLASLCAAAFVIPWKLASQYGPPESCLLVMLTTAAVLNGTALLLPDRTAQARRSEPLVLIGVAAAMSLLTLLGNYLSAEAVARMSGALLSVLQRLEIFVIAGLGALLLREYVRPGFWIGAIISLCGLLVLNAHKPSQGPTFDRLGTAFAVGAAVCFGSMAVIARKYVARVHPTLLNTVRLCLSVVLWFVFARRLPQTAELSPSLLWYAALAGFFGPFLSRIALLQSARHVPANVSALVALATPVFALLMGAVVMGTLPSTTELVGGAIMLVGIAIPFLQQAVAR